MKIMSINAGSSSLKFSLFEMNTKEVIISGLFERIGIQGGKYTIKYQGDKIIQDIDLEDHVKAIEILLDKLIALDVISSLDEIKGIGHRVVSGGEKYKESVLITDQVIQDLIELKDFAPLHNPAHVAAMNACRQVLPEVPMVAVFDTAFHQTMDEVSYLYPVPYEWYKKYGVRKYGAHGTSHRYVTEFISRELNNDHLRIICCHIGNGGSITAIKDKKCVDTSMGLTPLAGIMMGTRSGDIDPSIIPYVMEKEEIDIHEIIDDLNKKSGLLGLSEYSSDMRDIVDGVNEGRENCLRAQNKYVQTIVDYIARYYVRLGGADVICFTAGVGENSVPIRAKVLEKLAALGVKIDVEKNNNIHGTFGLISSSDSKIAVYVVPTDEELMIAQDTLELIR